MTDFSYEVYQNNELYQFLLHKLGVATYKKFVGDIISGTPVAPSNNVMLSFCRCFISVWLFICIFCQYLNDYNKTAKKEGQTIRIAPYRVSIMFFLALIKENPKTYKIFLHLDIIMKSKKSLTHLVLKIVLAE